MSSGLRGKLGAEGNGCKSMERVWSKVTTRNFEAELKESGAPIRESCGFCEVWWGGHAEN